MPPRWRWLLLLLAAAARLSVAEEEEEEEKASPLALGIAATLLGAVGFQMILLYMTNHVDADMRKYSYEIINATVSIFCAVLVFSTCNDLLETAFLAGLDPASQCMVDFAHMLFWYAMMQLALAWISGAIGDPPKDKLTFDLNVKCFAVLLAHLTGFASINAWGSLQQLPLFRANPLTAFLVVPMSAAGQFVLQRITDHIRWVVAMGDDGEEDEYEKMWDEEAEECENDVMGLTLSFNATQAIRFLISEKLPNQEGETSFEALTQHTHREMLELFGSAILSMCLLVMVYMLMPPKDNHEENHEDGQSDAADMIQRVAAHESSPGKEGLTRETSRGSTAKSRCSDGGKSIKEAMDEIVERGIDDMVLSFGMCFGWCSFYSAQMFLGSFSSVTHDEMELAVALTLFVSFISFASIRGLDIISDQMESKAKTTTDKNESRDDQRTVDAIKQIIKAIAILVGFGWEQCFDQAVATLSSRMWSPHLAKAMMAMGCIIVICPAWKWYLLPMAVREGWKFGFVVPEDADFLVDVLHKKINAHKRKQDSAEKVRILVNRMHSITDKHRDLLEHRVSMLGSSLKLGDISEEDQTRYQKLSDGEPTTAEDVAMEVMDIANREALEIQELKRDNEGLRKVLQEGLEALKALQQLEEQRARQMRERTSKIAEVVKEVRCAEVRPNGS